MAVPFSANHSLQVILRAQRLLLITDFQMVVDFDGKHSAGDRQGHRQQRTGVQLTPVTPPPLGPEVGGPSRAARAYITELSLKGTQSNPTAPKTTVQGFVGHTMILAVQR